jgi:putative tryptophan/tyrosine transport system substrate-binding protein
MKRRDFIVLVGGATAAWPVTVCAQQSTMPVVGFRNAASPQGYPWPLSAFLKGLGEAGYVDGRNVVIQYRWADGHNERSPAMAADLVQSQVTVIAATSTPAALAAKAATSSIPIVFETGGDPIRLGLVASLYRPGGNVTGAASLAVEVISTKGLELLHESIPSARVIGLLINPNDPAAAEPQEREVLSAPRTLGLEVHVLNAGTERDLDSIFAKLVDLQASALMISAGAFFSSHSKQLAELAVRHAIPTILRLSLMWNDLAAKSRTTPSAVLGMLDILNSRPWPEFDSDRLKDVVQGAARLAAAEPNEADALRFLSTLATKFANFDVGMLDSLNLPSLAQAITKRAPVNAMAYLQSEVAAGRDPVIPIVAGMADGLGESHFDGETSKLALELPPDLSAVMISHSAKYAREVWQRCATDASAWVPATKGAVGSMTRQDRADLLRKMPTWMTDEAQAPVMEAALEGVSGDDLADFAVAIGKHAEFGITAFDEPMANAARNAESLNGLRAAILSNFRGEGADRFLLSTMDLSATDVAWLDGEVERARAVGLLRQLLDNASPKSLVSVQRDPTSRDRMLALLMEDVAGSAAQLIRVADSSDLPIDRLLDVGRAALPFLASQQRDKFVGELLGRALAEADPDDARVASVLEESDGTRSPRQLVHLATPTGASPQRVAANLVLLSKASERVRRTAAAAIEDLCERLVHRYGENLGEGGYKAWASLLGEAGHRSPDVQLRASLPTLPFAMGKRDLPVSALIGAAFPPVYFELLRSTGQMAVEPSAGFLRMECRNQTERYRGATFLYRVYI